MKAHILQPDGTYKKKSLRGRQKVNAQEQFCAEAIEAARAMEESADPRNRRVFIPMEQ